ncbi:DUF6587 family protein [Candidatus Pandoraea novymonadis]|uniref:Uncharacterized protein n=1 Tax=Candidatus Pandoraea novymonadis TaxID=1808959 RepID=A0ABX5FDY3_9BURK|nr:DUF6587 family protein [Candidatus Pandoraea novymonadis]PSB91900.1 hypothetical protein BZL35_00118 [Candidatus Pandoraea novymonadis]
MKVSLWLQYITIVLIAFISILYLFQKILPTLAGKVQTAISLWLDRPDYARWIRVLGRACRPVDVPKVAKDCSSGCGTCTGCGMASSTDFIAQPRVVTFHRSVAKRGRTAGD